MSKYQKLFLPLFMYILSGVAIGQETPYLATQFDLRGYPKSVRVSKYDPSSQKKTQSPGEQRISFIDDYVLTFNPKRELERKEHYVKTQKDRYFTYAYDIERHLTKETMFDVDGKIVFETELKYNYLGRLAEVIATDFPKSIRGANKEVSRYSYVYDEAGKLIKRTEYDEGSPSIEITYTYNAQDSLILEHITYFYNKNEDRTTYKRDFKNDIVEKTMFRNEKQIRKEAYTLNKKNQLEEKHVFDGNNELKYIYRYTYDTYGNQLSEIGYDPDNKPVMEYSFKYTYDDTFNWTKRVRYDKTIARSIEIRKIEYWDKYHYDEYLNDQEVPLRVKDLEK